MKIAQDEYSTVPQSNTNSNTQKAASILGEINHLQSYAEGGLSVQRFPPGIAKKTSVSSMIVKNDSGDIKTVKIQSGVTSANSELESDIVLPLLNSTTDQVTGASDEKKNQSRNKRMSTKVSEDYILPKRRIMRRK